MLMLCNEWPTEADYSVHTYEVYLVRQRRGQGTGMLSLRGYIYRVTVFPPEADCQESVGWREC